jgi:hydroxylaminobenzene mutase
MWPRLALWPSWNNVIGHAVWISLYAIYVSLVLAAAFGAGRDLPIAGGGIATSRARQIPVTVLMGGGSVAIAVVIAAVLIGWHWQGA